MSDKIDEQLDFLFELARRNGSACTSTTDGHLIVLRKDTLNVLLEKNDSDVAVIFIKKQAEKQEN